MKNITPAFLSIAILIGAIGGILYGVTSWIEDRFGEMVAGAFWLMLFGALMLFLGVLIAGLIQKWTINGIVDFQAADDRGEVARANVVREMVRGQREYDRDVRRMVMPLAKQQAIVMAERKQLEAKQESEAKAASWWALPEDTEKDER